MELHSTPEYQQSTDVKESGQLYLDIMSIRDNPHQLRLNMSDKKLNDLTENIRMYGVLEPVLVCRFDNHTYTLIAGHRRLISSIVLGLKQIPARILPVQTIDLLGIAVTENMLREDCGTIEVALALGKLSELGAGRKNLCDITMLSFSSIAELLRIGKIPRSLLRECQQNGNTSKRFLIQLSRFGSEKEISEAYRHFQEHHKLPERRKRKYASNGNMKEILYLLSKLNVKLKENTDFDSLAVSPLEIKLRVEVTDFINGLKNCGLFMPPEFDASNRG